jgi:hypothetical protein
MTWAKYNLFTQDHTRVVGANQTSFPMPVWGTQTTMKSVANGGVMVNGSNDIGFYSDAGFTTLLPFERVIHDLTTGTYLYIVNTPLSFTADTPLYMPHGSAAQTTDLSNRTGTYDANYLEVHNWGDGTTLSLLDSTSNGATITNPAAAVAGAGLVGGAVVLNGTTQYLTRSTPVTGRPFTIETLFKPAALAGVISGIGQAAAAGQLEGEMSISGTALRANPNTGAAAAANSTGAVTNAAWNHGVVVFNTSTDRTVYLNGAAGVQSVVSSTDVVADELSIGARHTNGTTNNFFSGSVGIWRFSNIARSANWNRTISNSFGIGGAFYTDSGALTPSGGASLTTQPTTTVSGAAISPSVVWDGSAVDPTFAGVVTASVASGAGVLSGTLTAVAVSGVATFPNLRVTIATSDAAHTLSFAASGFTAVVSSSFTVTNPVQARWQAFATNNGGSAHWLGIKDWRVNATDDGSGLCSAWDDVRGAGAGKLATLSQGTQANRPAISAGLVFTAASSTHLLSALDTLLGMAQDAALSIIAIAKSGNGSAFPVIISQDPTDQTSLPYFGIATQGANWGMQANPGPSSTTNQLVLDGGVPFDSTLRVVLATKDFHYTATPALNGPGDYEYRLQVGGRMGRKQMSLPVANATASGMKLCVGRFGATYANLTLLALAVTDLTITASVKAAVEAFATSEFGAAMDRSKLGTIIFDDDSKNRGHNSSHPKGFTAGQDGSTAWPYLVAAASSGLGAWASRGVDTDIWAMDCASNGRTLTDCVANAPRIDVELDAGRTGRNILVTSPLNGSVVLESAYSGVGGDVALQAAFTSYIAARVAAGWKVIVYTCTDLLQFYTPNGTGTLNQSGINAVAMNVWLRSTGQFLPGVLGLIDFDTLGGSPFTINRAVSHANQDPTYYIVANSHPTDLGQVTLAGLARPLFDTNSWLNGLAGGGSLMFDTSYTQRQMKRHRRHA